MCPFVAVAQQLEYPNVETARAILQAIDDQKIPYDIVEPQLLHAMDVAERYEKKPVPGKDGTDPPTQRALEGIQPPYQVPSPQSEMLTCSITRV
ncbi:hypothetical protein BDV12DRAFT_193990 [Aspergillus spectabilis]